MTVLQKVLKKRDEKLEKFKETNKMYQGKENNITKEEHLKKRRKRIRTIERSIKW